MMRHNRKWIIGGILLATVAVFIGIFAFLNGITGQEWNEKKRAVETAYKQTMLAKADDAVPFVGTQPYMIVTGTDKIGQPLLVWVSETDVHAEYTANGLTREQVEANLQKDAPGSHVIRVTPGKLADAYAWEVYYKRVPPGAAHEKYYYTYYRFIDGQLLDTYSLGED